MKARDPRAWADFLARSEPRFVSATRAALQTLGTRRGLKPEDDVRSLARDAMGHFYEIFPIRFGARSLESFDSFLEESVRTFVEARLERNGVSLIRLSELSETAQVVRFPRNDPAHDVVRDCVRSLKDGYRVIIQLYHLNGQPLTLKQIAERLGLSLAAVQKRHQRALDILRDKFERRRRSSMRVA